MQIFELIVLLGAPVARSVAGWLENALEDGKIDKFELSQLGSTILRVGIISVGMYYGLDWSATAAAGSALVTDIILSKLTGAIKETSTKKSTKVKVPTTQTETK